MANPDTKDRIAEAALRLFNQYGLASVRLQHIADEVGISVGNLAYHFKNKEAIAQVLYYRFCDEFAKVLALYSTGPTFADLDRQLDGFFQFFARHRFYLLDFLELGRLVPVAPTHWQQQQHKLLLQLRRRLAYHVEQGDLRPEPEPDLYDLLAQNLWLTVIFWIPQQLMGQPAVDLTGGPYRQRYKAHIWAQVNPYLSAKGRLEFSGLAAPPRRDQR
ncbi:MAG: TetR/AcrR family transcriptional regulator [Bernardetiaceae bacterium]|jgi:AcrR family transcriptional regulator|nr:TetR/AcrR family transcriptional regulator [Bernardetiaceae bacterium]